MIRARLLKPQLFSKTVERMAESGISLDFQDDEGNTALHYLIRDGEARMARELVEKGAKTDIENHQGRSAETLSVMFGMHLC